MNLGNVVLADAEITDQLRVTNYAEDLSLSGVRLVNAARGRFLSGLGETSVTVQCSYVNPTTQIVVNQEVPDFLGSGFLVGAVTPGNGQFTVYFAAPCNSDGYPFSFFVIN